MFEWLDNVINDVWDTVSGDWFGGWTTEVADFGGAASDVAAGMDDTGFLGTWGTYGGFDLGNLDYIAKDAWLDGTGDDLSSLPFRDSDGVAPNLPDFKGDPSFGTGEWIIPEGYYADPSVVFGSGGAGNLAATKSGSASGSNLLSQLGNAALKAATRALSGQSGGGGGGSVATYNSLNAPPPPNPTPQRRQRQSSNPAAAILARNPLYPYTEALLGQR